MKTRISSYNVIVVCLLLSGCATTHMTLYIQLPYGVIIDPGHGGMDEGAVTGAIREDEANYDIACRMAWLLSGAGVQTRVTVWDPDHGYLPGHVLSVGDRDERSGPIAPAATGMSSRDRIDRINAFHREFLDAGIPEEHIALISIHNDCLHDDSLSGPSVYIPGAKYRRGDPQTGIREEALSHILADAVMHQFQREPERFPVSGISKPVRNVMRASGKAYVPAVLRCTTPSTRILVETTNLANERDRARVRSACWRDNCARVMAQALLAHFDLAPDGAKKATAAGEAEYL